MRGIREPVWYDADKRQRPRRLCRRPPCHFCLAWVAFSLLLTFVYKMSLPTTPSWSRLIDYQAFGLVGNAKGSASSPVSDLANSSTSPAAALGVADGPSYPLNVYAPLVPNPVPLTEVTVLACFPLMLQNCKPLTTPEKDARLGPWVRVEPPLDPDTAESRSHESDDFFGGIGVGSWFNQLMGSFEAKYLFYRRSRRTDVPRVVDMKLVETGKDERPIGGDYAGWHRVKADLKSSFFHIMEKTASMHLYYRTVGGTEEDRIGTHAEPPTQQTSESTELDSITELDVTYGPGPVWPGFDSLGMVTKAAPSVSRAKVTMSFRRKPVPLPEMPVTPLFNANGTFKIMQIADLHFGVRHEPCREVDWESPDKPCVGDVDTLKMLERWLDEEKPDMVVFSGDQLNGQTSSWDEKSVMPKYIAPLVERKIQWASIMGNHDSQSGVLTRREQQTLLSRLPYSRTLVGPASLHDGTGAGNYYLKLHSPTPDNMHVFSLYFIDSGVNAPKERLRPWKWTGYDYIRKDQTDWFLGVSKKIAQIARPYTPDGASDLGKLWKRNAARIRGVGPPGAAKKRRGTHLSKPRALLFTHIPVPEAFSPPDKDEKGNEVVWGHLGEKSTLEGAQKLGGIFDAIKAQGQDRDVVAMFHGHMHNNSGCRRVASIYICFNGGSSFAGYGHTGLQRATRIINISHFGEKVETWHRKETTAGAVDPHVLYEERP